MIFVIWCSATVAAVGLVLLGLVAYVALNEPQR
jgi:hypothetical protein